MTHNNEFRTLPVCQWLGKLIALVCSCFHWYNSSTSENMDLLMFSLVRLQCVSCFWVLNLGQIYKSMEWFKEQNRHGLWRKSMVTQEDWIHFMEEVLCTFSLDICSIFRIVVSTFSIVEFLKYYIQFSQSWICGYIFGSDNYFLSLSMLTEKQSNYIRANFSSQTLKLQPDERPFLLRCEIRLVMANCVSH